jgi:hypothetical protein
LIDAEVIEAIGRRLTFIGLPIVWQNSKPGLPDLPYLAFELVPTGRIDDTLDGIGHRLTGYAQVTVVSEIGSLANRAASIAESIAATFPKALKIRTESGVVTIVQATDIRQGFRDGPDWRIPIRIYYEGV